jgi:hypothetical protein
MKKNFTQKLSSLIVSILVLAASGMAQCPAGYTQAQLNWDHLDFLPSNNIRYSSFYPSAAFPYSQNFTIGPRSINMTMAPQASITLNGENGTHTGHAGSFATAGDDVQFTTTVASAATITTTFDIDVANVRFSIFDIDGNQRVNITATNAGGVPQSITMAKVVAASTITIAGSGSNSATATGPVTGYGINDPTGGINVTVAGPVKTIVITLSNAAGDIWLGDIDACVTGSFPNNYQQISRPFTGQPQYVLAVVNNNVYYIDPTNGKSYFLFNEPGHDRLNSMAYDPYRRVVYYTYSLTERVGLNPRNDKVLKKYDVDSKTISVVLPNVNSIGIPTYESGVESGAASFYNGSLYLGIEGYTGTTGSGAYAASRKTTVWKIDFDAAGNVVGNAAQVWGVTADDGTNAQNIHDWSDFAITNGRLVDFDGSSSGQIDFYSFDMMTGVRTRWAPSGVTPKQVSLGWDEAVYNVDFTISRYNGTNGLVAGTTHTMVAPLGPTIPTGSAASWGDAAGPYRPFLDFGDAPGTYDPDPWSPACHDTLTPTVAGKRTKMILGADEDVEWLKRGVTTVEDNHEDGLAFVPIFSPANSNYVAPLTVFNNTGTNATVCAWLDFNGNGLFDASEAVTPITVPSSATPQSIVLNWGSTPSSLPNGSYTYLRIRITDQASGMTINNSTGYYDIGEVEDYRVVVDYYPLAVNLISFNAKAVENKSVELAWSASEDEIFPGYEIQRSNNGQDWEHLAFVNAAGSAGLNNYRATDESPLAGVSYYRLKFVKSDQQVNYSTIESIRIQLKTDKVRLYPNPAVDKVWIAMNSGVNNANADIRLVSAQGKLLALQKFPVSRGSNIFTIPLHPTLPAGIYYIQVISGDEISNSPLVVRR